MPEAQFTEVYVFFASPSDLPEEHEAARELIEVLNQGFLSNEWRIEPIFWPDKGPTYGRPQDEMNRWLDRCHIFVGMLWRRWGTPTGNFTSGFEEEFERVVSRREQTGAPEIWTYLKNVDSGELHDPGPELRKVLAFKQRVESEERVFYTPFDSTDDWRTKLHRKLLEEITSRIKATAPSGEQTVGQREDLQTPQPASSNEEPERLSLEERESSPVEEETAEPGTDFERPWANALLSRALARAGMGERAREVESLGDRDPKQVGDLLVEIADALKPSHPVIAEHYRGAGRRRLPDGRRERASRRRTYQGRALADRARRVERTTYRASPCGLKRTGHGPSRGSSSCRAEMDRRGAPCAS